MNKIISYTTDVGLTAKIVEHFSDAINKHIKGWESEALHINHFLKNGFPKNVAAVATLGILRGSGHLLKEAAKKKISNLEMKIEMLVAAKDMLESMVIKLQDDTIDRLMLNNTLQYDDCKSGKCGCKNKCQDTN